MTVVVIILAVMAAVAIPHFLPADESKLNLATLEYANAIRFARSEAVRLGEPRGVHAQPAQKRIRVFRPDTGTTPWTPVYDVYHPVSKKLYDIQIDSHPFANADAVSLTPVFRDSCDRTEMIYFDAGGVPRCIDPETVLLDSLVLTVTLGGDSRVVSLSGISGRVSLQ